MSQVNLLHLLLGFAGDKSLPGSSLLQGSINKVIIILLFAFFTFTSIGCVVPCCSMGGTVVDINSCKQKLNFTDMQRLSNTQSYARYSAWQTYTRTSTHAKRKDNLRTSSFQTHDGISRKDKKVQLAKFETKLGESWRKGTSGQPRIRGYFTPNSTATHRWSNISKFCGCMFHYIAAESTFCMS